MVCESLNSSAVTINECRLKAINRNKTIYNFLATIHHPIDDIVVDIQLFKRANGYKPFLYKVKLNGCQFMKRAYNPIIIIIFKLMKDNSNLNHSCPFVVSGICSYSLITILSYCYSYLFYVMNTTGTCIFKKYSCDTR